jgi:beta-galactosidase/beta-glucuronidase
VNIWDNISATTGGQAGGDPVPRPEYPRPDFVRERWMNLNGHWDFEFDDGDDGISLGWFCNPEFEQEIIVPLPFQAAKSGIGDTGFHDVFWYHREVKIPSDWQSNGKVLLHIGAFDYKGTLWVNGNLVGTHQGGYTPWTSDITEYLEGSSTSIVIRGVDKQEKGQPRGKQHWECEPSGIMYHRVSGAWQTIWLEPVAKTYIESVRIIPALDPDRLTIKVNIAGATSNCHLSVTVQSGNTEVSKGEGTVSSAETSLDLIIPNANRWSPSSPFLYDVHFRLSSGHEVIDEVKSYAGIRQVSRQGRNILINGEPIKFKAVLDQGYFPEGLYTPASDQEIHRDVELLRALGFNGARKHQKVDDPRWYYWCDRLGVLVWSEMPSAWEYSTEVRDAFREEWPAVIRRDWNHPCIIAWVPFNENWGIPEVVESKDQQDFLRETVTTTRTMDPTRLVIDNSGWCHLDTDIIDIHNYSETPDEIKTQITAMLGPDTEPDSKNTPPLWVGDGQDKGQPIIISEYGGIAVGIDKAPDGDQGIVWGYGKPAANAQELVTRFNSLTLAIMENPDISGYCFTQFTDIDPEMNGLLTFLRQPKAPLALFARTQSKIK